MGDVKGSNGQWDQGGVQGVRGGQVGRLGVSGFKGEADGSSDDL